MFHGFVVVVAALHELDLKFGGVGVDQTTLLLLLVAGHLMAPVDCYGYPCINDADCQYAGCNDIANPGGGVYSSVCVRNQPFLPPILFLADSAFELCERAGRPCFQS